MQMRAIQPGDFVYRSKVELRLPSPLSQKSIKFTAFKFLFDKCFALTAIPVVALIGLALLILNPIFNPGPVFYLQDRMGLGGGRFRMIKFRTMRPSAAEARGVHEPLEEERITPLGRFLRRTRIDELPNLLNVMRGDMSVVGPRAECYGHALAYIATVPHYRERFRVLPGITGLAQICGGYADTERAVARKARLDRFYVRKSRALLDLYIIWLTPAVMITGYGAR